MSSIGFAVNYIAFAVSHLVLPRTLRFCREVFGFVVNLFGFAASRF